MDIDFSKYLHSIDRKVESLEFKGKDARAIILERKFNTTIDDVWDALTNKERLDRWFLPISGDLKLKGRYQFEGNAGGEILRCDQPTFLEVTWEFGGVPSWVEITLNELGEGKEQVKLVLKHIMHHSDHWLQFGAGATGVGWELGLLGLVLHFKHPDKEKSGENNFATTPEGRELIIGSSKAWGEASIAGGEDEKLALESAKRTTAFYTGTQ